MQEKEQARQEVVDVQTALQDLEVKEQQETAEKHKLQQSVTLPLFLSLSTSLVFCTHTLWCVING